jgi:hypothetical protein
VSRTAKSQAWSIGGAAQAERGEFILPIQRAGGFLIRIEGRQLPFKYCERHFLATASIISIDYHLLGKHLLSASFVGTAAAWRAR